MISECNEMIAFKDSTHARLIPLLFAAILIFMHCTSQPVVDPNGLPIVTREFFDEAAPELSKSDSLAARIRKYEELHRGAKNVRSIEIHKSKFILNALLDDTIIKSYPITLGIRFDRRKMERNDGATPEGVYRVCALDRRSDFTRMILLNYPNERDAADGLSEGIITRKEFDRIRYLSRIQPIPPQDTPLGGDVGIHGKGTFTVDGNRISFVNKTLGCIALSDDDIIELYDEFVRLGIKVTIDAD